MQNVLILSYLNNSDDITLYPSDLFQPLDLTASASGPAAEVGVARVSGGVLQNWDLVAGQIRVQKQSEPAPEPEC